MDCLAEGRKLTFCAACAMRSRSRARIFSRSTATDFMRLVSESVSSIGIVSVNTVAMAATEALTIATDLTLNELIRKSSIGPLRPYPSADLFQALEIEIDHLLHDQHAHRHPDDGRGEHDAAKRLGP